MGALATRLAGDDATQLCLSCAQPPTYKTPKCSFPTKPTGPSQLHSSMTSQQAHKSATGVRAQAFHNLNASALKRLPSGVDKGTWGLPCNNDKKAKPSSWPGRSRGQMPNIHTVWPRDTDSTCMQAQMAGHAGMKKTDPQALLVVVQSHSHELHTSSAAHARQHGRGESWCCLMGMKGQREKPKQGRQQGQQQAGRRATCTLHPSPTPPPSHTQCAGDSNRSMRKLNGEQRAPGAGMKRLMAARCSGVRRKRPSGRCPRSSVQQQVRHAA